MYVIVHLNNIKNKVYEKRKTSKSTKVAQVVSNPFVCAYNFEYAVVRSGSWYNILALGIFKIAHCI